MTFKEIKQMFKDYKEWGNRLEVLQARYDYYNTYDGIHSAKLDASVLGGDAMTLIDVIEEKDKIEKEILKIKTKINIFSKVIDSLTQEEREIMFKLYSINNQYKKADQKARELNYSRSSMFRKATKILKKISRLIN